MMKFDSIERQMYTIQLKYPLEIQQILLELNCAFKYAALLL